MRRSSSITPSRNGTLKSTRTSTRVPALERQVFEARQVNGHRRAGIGATCADERDEVDEAVRVAPLVVVPAEHLHHACRWPSCRSAEKMHDDGLPTMSADTSGSSLYSSTPRYDLSLAAACERGVDLVDRDVLRRGSADEVGDRTGRRRHAQRRAVELALELGQHEADRPRRAGGARDDRQRRRRACGGGRACRCGSALARSCELTGRSCRRAPWS